MPPGSTSHPQGPPLISVITVIRSSLWPQTQLQPHCLSFQANTTPLSPASKNQLPKSPAPKSILCSASRRKLTGASISLPPPHFMGTIIAAAAAAVFIASILILLPRVSSTSASTSYLPFSKSKPQKTSSSTVPERLVPRLPDCHKLITC